MKTITSLLLTLTFGLSTLWAGLDDDRYQEIHLQGDYTFAGIISESERQLGVSIKLPLGADDALSSSYNQIISLRQLVDAIVVHFAQDNVPLDWRFEAKRLTFSRRDMISRSARKNANVSRPKYPVPVLSEPAQPLEEPKLPTWAETPKPNRTSPNRQTAPPTLSRSGIQGKTTQRPPVPRPTLTMDMDDLESPTQDSGAFSVSIPKKRQTVVMSPSPTTPSRPQPSNPSSYLSPRSTPSAPRSLPRAASSLGDARGETFGITPYPEDAVAFINDAPSIVPGEARENYIEWKTRMEGAIQNGHRSALKNEQKDLERRLLWLRSQLK